MDVFGRSTLGGSSYILRQGPAGTSASYKGEWIAGTYGYLNMVKNNEFLWLCTNMVGTSDEPPSADWISMGNNISDSERAKLSLLTIAEAIDLDAIKAHTTDLVNPHAINKEQLGLGTDDTLELFQLTTHYIRSLNAGVSVICMLKDDDVGSFTVSNDSGSVRATLGNMDDSEACGGYVCGKYLSAKTYVQTDSIVERTTDAGVNIDGVLLKDSTVQTDSIIESTPDAGVNVDGVLLKDSTVQASTIIESTPDAGINVDGVILKDNTVVASEITSTTGDITNMRVYSGTHSIVSASTSGSTVIRVKCQGLSTHRPVVGSIIIALVPADGALFGHCSYQFFGRKNDNGIYDTSITNHGQSNFTSFSLSHASSTEIYLNFDFTTNESETVYISYILTLGGGMSFVSIT